MFLNKDNNNKGDKDILNNIDYIALIVKAILLIFKDVDYLLTTIKSLHSLLLNINYITTTIKNTLISFKELEGNIIIEEKLIIKRELIFVLGRNKSLESHYKLIEL
jgi:hypothetical protein